MTNIVTGNFQGMPIRVFEGKFVTGDAKTRSHHVYAAYAFQFAGTFPHFYLNRKDNKYTHVTQTLPRLALQHAFSQKFDVYVPKEYEMEALQIFTPDLLAYLLDTDWPHDVEFVDNTMFVVRKHIIQRRSEFLHDLESVGALAERVRNNVQGMRYAPVGDLPPLLRNVSLTWYGKIRKYVEDKPSLVAHVAGLVLGAGVVLLIVLIGRVK